MAASRPRSLNLRAVALVLCGVLVDATALTGNFGCRACTDDVCFSRARVIVGEPGDGPLLAGTYLIELTADDVSATSTCEVGAGGVSIDCGELAGFQLSAPLFDSAPGTPHTQLWFDFGEQLPETVTLQIFHKGAVVLNRAIMLDYRLSEPGCDDECREAIEELAFDRE